MVVSKIQPHSYDSESFLGPSPSGKAQDFDSCIPRVRIPLAQEMIRKSSACIFYYKHFFYLFATGNLTSERG